ncbi:proteasome endopeptidase complex protein [Nitzschia inconspicua]|uniref:Proteasome endopeptidase complex protein n=1 Tax=Nitzschia inconspicua TaxID=303405 RepID=A0A9K3Q6Y4_9STRA|nr:proteasome endopeptidase complex protein [Nitzschia inconspicua]
MRLTTYPILQPFHHYNVILCVIVVLGIVQQPLSTLASQAAGTETLIGIVGKDFVLLAADSSVSQSIALTASNLDKIATLSNPFPDVSPTTTKTTAIMSTIRNEGAVHHPRQMAIAAAAAGNAADSDRLVTILRSYATIEEYKNGWGCDVDIVVPSSSINDPMIKSSCRPGLDVDAMAHFTRRIIADSLRSSSPFQVCLLLAGMQYTASRNNNINIDNGNSDETINNSLHSNEMQKQPQPSSSSLQTTGNKFPSHLVQRQTQQAWGISPPKERVTNHVSSSSLESLSTSLSATKCNTISRYEPRLYWLDEYGSLQQVQYGAHGLGANFLLSILDRGYRDDMTLEEAVDLANACFRELRTRYLVNSPQPPCIKCIHANGIHLIRDDEREKTVM